MEQMLPKQRACVSLKLIKFTPNLKINYSIIIRKKKFVLVVHHYYEAHIWGKMNQVM